MAFDAERANGFSGLVDHRGDPVQWGGRNVGTTTSPREGLDGFDIPHVLQFISQTGSQRIFYRDSWDAALRQGRDGALAMELDTGLMGPLQERMLATATLPGHVAVPDDRDPIQKAVRDHLTRAIAGMVGPEENMLKYRMNLLWGVWFGRQGAKPVWRWQRIDGVKTLTQVDWSPVRGDKISTTKDGIPATDVYGGSDQEQFPDSDITTTTNGARALVLRGDMTWGWRTRMTIHRHELIDADFFDSQAAEAAMGLGVRSRVFWLDWVRREWLSRICDFIDRVGLGVTIWYYQAGNPAAKTQAESAAKAQGNRTNILVPLYGGENDKRKYVERLEVPVNGAEFLLRMMQDIREQQRLYIIGQTMSTGGDHVGGDMGGSFRAKFAQDTKAKIIEFDARNLDATLTGSMKNPGLISMMQYWTFPSTWPTEANPDGFRARWVTDMEDEESEGKLEAAAKLWGMGIDLKEDEVRGAGGFTKPAEGDAVIGGNQGMDPFAGAPGGAPGAEDSAGQSEEEEEEPGEPPQDAPFQHARPEGSDAEYRGERVTYAGEPSQYSRHKGGNDIDPPKDGMPGPDMELYEAIVEVMPTKRPAKLPHSCGKVRGFEVCLVDGNEVKLRKRKGKENKKGDPDFMEFVEGGNGQEDPELCGPDEVYIDALIDPVSWCFIAYHELHEAADMKGGMTYDKAHARANHGERILRERAAKDVE